MKKTIKLIVMLMIIPIMGFTQTLKDLDYISPFNDGVAAIKKNNQWAFINTDGAIVVDFRDDLVPTQVDDSGYPIFNSDRCLISQKKDGISYFGYIDKTGKTVVKPQFLNASNFKDDMAFALLLKRTEVSKNVALGKAVVYYNYFEVLIDKQGEALEYLSDANHITLDKEYLVRPPAISSKFISDRLVVTLDKNKKWRLIKMN